MSGRYLLVSSASAFRALGRTKSFSPASPRAVAAIWRGLAAALSTFVNRFPRWREYLADIPEDGPSEEDIRAAEPDFAALKDALQEAEDVDPAIVMEFERAAEAVRDAPGSAFALGLLASTRELLRVLADDALTAWRLYRDSAKDKAVSAKTWLSNELKEWKKTAGSELRKVGFWTALGVTFDVLALRGSMLGSLATRFPDQLGWLKDVLTFFGL